MKNLLAQKSALKAKADAIRNDASKTDELLGIVADLEKVNGQIHAQEVLEAEDRAAAAALVPVPENTVKKLFSSFGEQLRAVRNVAVSGTRDERLALLNSSAGANEAVGADGGFLVQTDFGGNILDSLYKKSAILSRVNVKDISANANGVQFAVVKETSIDSSVAGGVQAYWVPEGENLTASKATFANVKIDLQKVCALAYVTEEQLADAQFLGSFLTDCFAQAIDRAICSAIIGADGNGKPLGILHSTGLVTVAKEASQAADTVNAKNLVKMYARMTQEQRSNAVWLMNPDVAAELPFIYMSTGSYSGAPVYLPAGGFSGTPYATLFGMPIIEDDNCSALGDLGDVILADLSQYLFIRKGGIKTDVSIHVQFLTAQQAFRAIYRCGGAPMKNWTTTIKNSTLPRGSFIALAERS